MKKFLLISAMLFTMTSEMFSQSEGVGIGISNPLEMLHVNGAISVSSDFNNNALTAPLGGSGTIRYRAGTFEGWNGTDWVGFAGSGNSDDQIIEELTLSGTNLSIRMESDINGTQTVDLEPLRRLLIDEDDDTWIMTEDNSGNDNDVIRLATSNVERMRIDDSGNVGIGTTPSAQLHTTGTVKHENLSGSGTRMVVADANGGLSTQEIPSTDGVVVITPKVSLHLTNSLTSYDVTGVSFIELSTNSSSNEIKGLTGGVVGQVIYLVNKDGDDDILLKKDEGNQRFRLDISVKKKQGAIIMFNGTHWYAVSQDG